MTASTQLREWMRACGFRRLLWVAGLTALTAALLHLAYLLGDRYHLWGVPSVPGVWLDDPFYPNKGKLAIQSHLTSHECLRNWRTSSEKEVLEYSKSYRDAWTGEAAAYCASGGSLAMTGSGDPKHLPHFAYDYFTYLSLLSWQDLIYDGKSCLRHFLVDEQAIEFWTAISKAKPIWVQQVLHYTGMAITVNHLASTTTAIENHGVKLLPVPIDGRRIWFLHGSEATWLGSVILGEKDVCSGVSNTRASRIAKKSLNVLILQREWARKLLNPDEIVDTFHHLGGATRFNTSVVNFDGKRLEEQVRDTRDADVIMSVHGAGLTNWGFLRPCAIAIEVLPFGLGVAPNSHYFGVLVNRVGALHYSWVESKPHCPLIKDAFLDGGYNCKKIFNPIPSDPADAVKWCYPNKYCRACAKLTAVNVNTTTLKSVLDTALEDRQKCLRTHPLYA